jgi:hypothetical protein
VRPGDPKTESSRERRLDDLGGLEDLISLLALLGDTDRDDRIAIGQVQEPFFGLLS